MCSVLIIFFFLNKCYLHIISLSKSLNCIRKLYKSNKNQPLVFILDGLFSTYVSPPIYFVRQQAESTFECHTNITGEYTLSWHFNDAKLPANVVVTGSMDHKLSIYPTEKPNQGLYKCIIKRRNHTDITAYGKLIVARKYIMRIILKCNWSI